MSNLWKENIRFMFVIFLEKIMMESKGAILVNLKCKFLVKINRYIKLGMNKYLKIKKISIVHLNIKKK